MDITQGRYREWICDGVTVLGVKKEQCTINKTENTVLM